jgi:glycosyltransferase involved in cell wall biosynthesis
MTDSVPRRTLFIAFYTASPPTGGASAVTFHLARHWPGERKLVQIGDRPGICEAAPGLQVETLAYRGQGERWQKLAKVPGWIAQMAAIAATYRPGMIILEGASWCAYHWCLMKVLRQRVPDATLIYHAHNVEYDLRRQKHNWVIAELTRWFERRVLAGADIATSVSPADANRFCSLYGRKTVSLPNGVDAAWLQSVSPQTVETVRVRYALTPETVLFMGAYAYRPNREAIDFLVNAVFPALIRKKPQARLLILGGPVPYERPWLIAPGLVLSGDLPGFIRAAAVSVAPIFSGSGTRLKILESLAAGVPVISTAKGIEGLPLEPGSDFLPAETAETFVDALLKVFDADVSVSTSTTAKMAALHWPAVIRTFLSETALWQNS